MNLSNASYRPAYYRHGNHYHGHWNGNQGWGHGPGPNRPGYGYGYGRGWGYQPYFWGLGGWGLGSLMYGSGYLGYHNPYYTPAYAAYGYNYAQPIPVAYNVQTTDPNVTTPNSASDSLDAAADAFKQNNYDAALDLVNQGIKQQPDDAVLHEFRALVLFAKGDYQQAASTVHSVLAVGPGWDWTTLSGLYADVGIYTTQLRNLEAFTKQNPQDAAGHFLLAYHYMSDGYPDAAARQLKQVVDLVPNDTVAASLLKMTTSQAQEGNQTSEPAANPTPQPPVDLPAPGASSSSEAAPKPLDPSVIMGTWNASRDDGSMFGLTLKDDKSFSWTFTPKDQPAQAFDGTYTLDGNVIALERSGGGSLVAQIDPMEQSKFNFKMVGAPPDDPGLDFIR